MHYRRTTRAAAAASSPDSTARDCLAPRRRGPGHEPTLTLWATRPLTVPGGRLVAVRKRSDVLRVGLVSSGGLSWVRPESALTEAQAQRWAASSRFHFRE